MRFAPSQKEKVEQVAADEGVSRESITRSKRRLVETKCAWDLGRLLWKSVGIAVDDVDKGLWKEDRH